jgi:hypothetical protein
MTKNENIKQNKKEGKNGKKGKFLQEFLFINCYFMFLLFYCLFF